MSIRKKVNFVPHTHIGVGNFHSDDIANINNIIVKTDNPDFRWIEEITSHIGDWRSLTRSTYLRWAMTINGLFKAEEFYKHLPTNEEFFAQTIRQTGSTPTFVNLLHCSGQKAASYHRQTADLIAAYGLVDLFGCLEEIIFEMYMIFLDHHPLTILKGPEFSEIRKLYRAYQADPINTPDWNDVWNARKEKWQRKRLYDGLGKVILAFFDQTKLQKPSQYQHTTPEHWAETVTGISELRNLIVHSVDHVSENLAEFCTKPHSMGWRFKTGEPLIVKTIDMMGVECFCDQLLTAINISLVEMYEAHTATS